MMQSVFQKEASGAERTMAQRARGWTSPRNETMRPELHWCQDGFERIGPAMCKEVRLIRFSSVVNEVERVKACPATAEREAVTSKALPRLWSIWADLSSLSVFYLCILVGLSPFLSHNTPFHFSINPCPHVVSALLLLDTSICITIAYFFTALVTSFLTVQRKLGPDVLLDGGRIKPTALRPQRRK